MTVEQTSKGIQWVTIIVLFTITALVVFNAQLGVLKWITNYSVQIMLGMLVLGFVFFIFSKERLMFSSLICCSLLCLFLQKSANANLVLPAYSSGTIFKIVHANLMNVTGDMEEVLSSIAAVDADLVSLQEVNFTLVDRLNEIFQEKYPYRSGPMKRNDFWSVNVLSKKPITNLDTFYFADIPNLHGSIHIQEEEPPIHFISSYILPPFSDREGNNNFQDHLDQVASRKRSESAPYIVFGDFNVAGWYDEIQDFRERTGLMDSRRGYMPAVSNLFSYPVDHIFFSYQLKCVGFETLESPSAGRIGIVGTYQFDEVYLDYPE